MIMLFCLGCIFSGLICLLLTSLVKEDISCHMLTAFMQTFFLSSITWINALSVYNCRTLSLARPVAHSLIGLKYYCLYGVLLPVTCTLFASVFRGSNVKIYQDPACLGKFKEVSFSLFYIPVYILAIANIVLFIMCSIRVMDPHYYTPSNADSEPAWDRVIVCLQSTLLLILGWGLLFTTGYEKISWLSAVKLIEVQGILGVLAQFNWCKIIARRMCKRRLEERRPIQRRASYAPGWSPSTPGEDNSKLEMAERPTEGVKLLQHRGVRWSWHEI